MDLTEAEDLKTGSKNIYRKKKDIHDPDNQDGLVTHLEADIWCMKSSGP